MYKINKKILLFFIILFFLFGCKTKKDNKKDEQVIDEEKTVVQYEQKTGKAVYGQLQVIGTQLCDESGSPVQLKGIGSHGMQWYSHYMNGRTISWLKQDWNITVTRAAVYVDPKIKGYVSDPGIMNKVKRAIDASINEEIYILVDWHILSDGDPNTYKSYAKSFFKKIALIYGNSQNIIYEICNEPNGKHVTWNDKIKPYAEEMIEFIREIDPDGIIVVGTGTWSQDIHHAAADPVNYDNIMYTCHFYADSHREFLRDRVEGCLNGKFGNKIPIFVTEWGTTDYTGEKNYNVNQTMIWINFLNERKISWCNWSLSDKGEDSGALKPGTSIMGEWEDDQLTESGKLVRKLIRGK